MTFPGTGEPITAETLNARGDGKLPGLLGVEITRVEDGLVEARLELKPHHLAPNGYLHAATVIALADTACGYGSLRSRPGESTGFTTVELKSNFLGTALAGTIACKATLAHGGRMTQVWDATVVDEGTGKTIALFRCTQMMLYPPAKFGTIGNAGAATKGGGAAPASG